MRNAIEKTNVKGGTSPILFVFGAARSGTTFLNGFLFRWFDVGTGPEGQFVDRYYRRLGRYGNLSVPENLDRLIGEIARCDMLEIIRHRWPDDISFDVTPEKIHQNLLGSTYADVVHAVFRCVADGQDRSIVGNKFPGYWRNLDLLEKLFGDRALYLGIIRDGRDVALSTMRTPWGESNAYSCALNWRECALTTSRFGKKIDPNRFLLIRYEDVLTNPAGVTERISELLGVSLSPEAKAGAIDEARSSAAKHRLAKWKEGMSAPDRRRFEAVAGDMLAENGYELSLEAPSVSTAEATFLHGVELTHKVVRNARSLRNRLSSS